MDRLDARWQALVEDVVTGMQDWRSAHPQASFAEIEAAVDERLARMRARLLEEAALASRAADVGALPETERPRCPACGQALAERGRHPRTLTVPGNESVRLERSYAVCPACGAGFFPPR
jgi:YgiT-type zinc finger domain-containing protein